MRILPLLFFLLLLSTNALQSQIHRYPENGGAGVAGSIPGSYLIGWNRFEGAIGYEYVVSDNPLCFVGCAGDTRNSVVQDTVVLEYDLTPQKWYYWITRIYFADGDTAHWSPISSFFTESPDDLPRLVTPAQNPVVGNTLSLLIDWARNPEALEMKINLFDQTGYLLRQESYRRNLAGARFEEAQIAVQDLPGGYYFVDVLAETNRNNRNNSFTIKVQIVR